MIVGNFDVEFQESSITFSDTGTWYDFVSGESLDIESVDQEFDLAPGEFRIYTSEQVEPAEEGVFYRAGESNFGELPEDFILESNYPNPFYSTTTLRYVVPEEREVKIEVYDVLGRRVQTLGRRPSTRTGKSYRRF